MYCPALLFKKGNGLCKEEKHFILIKNNNMKNTSQLFRTLIVCAAFALTTAAFTSCANGTSTTGSDTTTTSAPATTDTMSAPSSATSDTMRVPRDTTRKDSM